MVLTDAQLLKGRDPVDACRQAVLGGATAVQLRIKPPEARAMAELGRALVLALPVPVLINDRVDVALAIGAAGAHLGQADPPLDAMRELVPPSFVLGVSVGSEAEAQRVKRWSADYWSIGPCFGTARKLDAGPPLGPEGFAALARLAPSGIPVLGIGGITCDNVGSIIAAGASGIAVISAVWQAPDPAQAAHALRSSIV